MWPPTALLCLFTLLETCYGKICWFSFLICFLENISFFKPYWGKTDTAKAVSRVCSKPKEKHIRDGKANTCWELQKHCQGERGGSREIAQFKGVHSFSHLWKLRQSQNCSADRLPYICLAWKHHCLQLGHYQNGCSNPVLDYPRASALPRKCQDTTPVLLAESI